MKTRAELKSEAKAVLAGRWSKAVLLNLIPTLIQIAVLLVMLIPLILIAASIDWTSFADQMSDAISDQAGNPGSNGTSLIGSIIGALFASGINWTYLELLRGQRRDIEPLPNALRAFSGRFFLGILLITLFSAIFLTLWALLLVIPMFVKYYAYSQATYVYYDIVESTGQAPRALDCITYSRKLMDGHKMDLFLLDLSFIGWHILAAIPFFLGYLLLNPYISATKAAFYNNLPNEVILD